MSLSNDEMSVLMIAAQGQTMLPIGRWEGPTKSLAARGFMKCEILAGGPQYTITDAGHLALNNSEKEDDDRLTQAIAKANNATHTAKKCAEEAAVLLTQAIRSTQTVTGESPDIIARKWCATIQRRALELLDG